MSNPYSFGSGTLIGVRTDIANQTPAAFGVIQSADVDFNFDLKELVGQYQAPVAIARAALKMDIKIKAARISGALFNSLYFGQTLAAGVTLTVLNEPHSVPAPSGPYTVTVTNTTGFVDQGVFYASTGVQLGRVASGSEATGFYSVSTSGVYTFVIGDASTAMLFTYNYTAGSGGYKIALANQLMGAAPTFQLNLSEVFNSNVFNIQFNACVAGKLSLPFKNTDFTMYDFECKALVDNSNNIGNITVTQQ